MSSFKQTWWDDNLANRFKEFEFWIGDKNSISKAFFRKYVKEKGYKSLMDYGCGTATEFFGYREEYPELKYVGVDSCKFLFDRNRELGVPMFLLSDDEDIKLLPRSYEVVFSRHVLEHQPHFNPLLSHYIDLAYKEAIHVFFIPPGDVEYIGYDSKENLYHNLYRKKDIEEYVNSRDDVESFSWIPITDTEIALSIIKKTSGK